MASALNPVTLKSSDVIYVSLLSGLGILQGAAFYSSRHGSGSATRLTSSLILPLASTT